MGSNVDRGDVTSHCYAAIPWNTQMSFKALEGKTIKTATHVKRPTNDDDGWLLLEFTDETKCVICAYYGGYTSESEDEYPTRICVSENVDGFVPVDPSA